MKPTLLAGGFLCCIQAFAHSIAFLSPHIGSGSAPRCPGRHVKAPVPFRKTRDLPAWSMKTTVASLATAGGAAERAHLIKSSSLGVARIGGRGCEVTNSG